MVLLTLPRNENMRPSAAMEYMQRGREKREPRRVVVIPQRAPMETAYLAQVRPTEDIASGRAAVRLIEE